MEGKHENITSDGGGHAGGKDYEDVLKVGVADSDSFRPNEQASKQANEWSASPREISCEAPMTNPSIFIRWGKFQADAAGTIAILALAGC
ncbi:MAG: hypothetical protein JO328_08455 [Hyphomicrobiales bacterium]|nr:hypothetical protein [Hyphomicrobiales bacterium]MBV9430056.1 hypothetical protein [Bradyrhizobiaceae bacterium]